MIKTKCIIVDIDGTLSSCEHRVHHVTCDKKNWDAFFADMDKDPVIEPIANLVRDVYGLSALRVLDAMVAFKNSSKYSISNIDDLNQVISDAKTAIILCTGRGEEYREPTVAWLEKHNIPYDKLMLRPAKDFRSDAEIKKEMLEELQKDYKVQYVLEDRDICVKMWRDNGLVCLQVAPGNF